jgi:hypothetical protein
MLAKKKYISVLLHLYALGPPCDLLTLAAIVFKLIK